MTKKAIISILCHDRIGLVASVADRLFDLGANLDDTAFAVLGGAAKFTSICELPDDISYMAVEGELRALPVLEDAELTVHPFEQDPIHGPSSDISHRIVVSGGDRPGLIARLCEVFIEFNSNIVRLNAERIPSKNGIQYVIRISVSIPEKSAKACLATVTNTAGGLGLDCQWSEA